MNEIMNTRDLDILSLKEEYLSYIDVSDNSVNTYNVGIKAFAEYLKEKDVKRPTRADVINFREYLKEEHTIPTINSYLIAVRNFFRFLEYNGIYKNIAENVKGLRDTELHKRNALTLEQCNLLIENAKDDREKIIILLALTCGLRINEITNVRIEDFKQENGNIVLYVLGKGKTDKVDYVIVDKDIFEMIKDYVRKYEISDYLFVSNSNNHKGEKMHSGSIRAIVNSMYERAGLKTDKVVFHSLRHSFATIALENGQDIREVSKALRHSNLGVTERYAHDIQAKNNKCSSVVTNCVLKSKDVV